MGADQLAHLLKDNTDRNRTSPFAFTGNKFEFRAVGSSQAVGWPSTILNTAMAQALTEAAGLVEQYKSAGKTTDEALIELIRTLMKRSGNVVFGGDGYSEEWVKEAAKRGLPNLRTSPEALSVLKDENQTRFLVEQGVLRSEEIRTRYNVMMDNYCLYREIEIQTMLTMVTQNVLPCGLDYKTRLATIIKDQKTIGLESSVEVELYKRLNTVVENVFDTARQLKSAMEDLSSDSEVRAKELAATIMPLSKKVASACNSLEEMTPDDMWRLPKFYDMLFLR
jgi:glutamine synthetase